MTIPKSDYFVTDRNHYKTSAYALKAYTTVSYVVICIERICDCFLCSNMHCVHMHIWPYPRVTISWQTEMTARRLGYVFFLERNSHTNTTSCEMIFTYDVVFVWHDIFISDVYYASYEYDMMWIRHVTRRLRRVFLLGFVFVLVHMPYQMSYKCCIHVTLYSYDVVFMCHDILFCRISSLL